jgi:uncharacterized protein YecE (DUF72 family)
VIDDRVGAGRCYTVTSGFAYRDWAPRFYPAGIRGEGLLRHYASRLRAVELNNTFYQQPRPPRVDAWLAATDADFRFVVKAQRGGAFRALRGEAAAALEWLLPPYRRFGDRLGAVLFRIGEETRRDDAALGRLLAAWPRDLRLAVEMQHPSWEDDEVHRLLRDHGAALVATDRDDHPQPDIRRTASFLYLRLRRTGYAPADLAAWAARIRPFLDDGIDAYVFCRHDSDGSSALAAETLGAMIGGVAGHRAGPRSCSGRSIG